MTCRAKDAKGRERGIEVDAAGPSDSHGQGDGLGDAHTVFSFLTTT
jgi:hypothetical protein